MPILAPGLSWIDLKFRGSHHVIATAVVSDAGGVALIDPGPASCLETLELGLNAQGIKQLHEQGVRVVVSVDCGISNYNEVELAQARRH